MSYFLRRSGSVSTSCARFKSSIFTGDGPLYLSGWYFFAMSLNAFFIVAVSAVFLTPSSL